MPYTATLINSHTLMRRVSYNSASLGAHKPALLSPAWVASSTSHTPLGPLSPWGPFTGEALADLKPSASFG